MDNSFHKYKHCDHSICIHVLHELLMSINSSYDNNCKLLQGDIATINVINGLISPCKVSQAHYAVVESVLG